MKKNIFLFFACICTTILVAQTSKFNAPVVDDTYVFEEKEGIVAVEAEYFYKQSKPEIREWFRTSKNENPSVGRDDDAQHCYGASNNAYIEILPDERVTHADELRANDNFSNVPGKMAIVHYKVKINSPGRYYVWVRAFSSGGEDNGIHVGIDGEWPAHGKRMQWCKGRNRWTWESKQRTKKVHCGVAKEIYLDIDKAGVHDVQFSMREDGFEFDKFILTKDENYSPSKLGPEMVSLGKLPKPFPVVAKPLPKEPYFVSLVKSSSKNKAIGAHDFLTEKTNFYKNGVNWLAVNPKKHKEATASTHFKFVSGVYDVVFVGVGEANGQSVFTVKINGKNIGSCKLPSTKKIVAQGVPFNALWENIKLKKGDVISVTGQAVSAGHKYSKARWAGIIFTPLGKGKEVKNREVSK